MGKGKGRSKIEMKKIESLDKRYVTFSKRRDGLFKKSTEICKKFPGTSVAAVVFSPAGNPFVFGGGDTVAILKNLGLDFSDIAEKINLEEEEETNLGDQEISNNSIVTFSDFSDSYVPVEIPDFDFSDLSDSSAPVPFEIPITDFDSSDFSNSSVPVEIPIDFSDSSVAAEIPVNFFDFSDCSVPVEIPIDFSDSSVPAEIPIDFFDFSNSSVHVEIPIDISEDDLLEEDEALMYELRSLTH